MRLSELLPASYSQLASLDINHKNTAIITSKIPNTTALASSKKTAIYANIISNTKKEERDKGIKKNVFSVVCNSPEKSVTSLPVLVTANDFCDIFKILLYKTVATHLLILEANNLDSSKNPFLTCIDINAFNRKNMHLHNPSASLSPL